MKYEYGMSVQVAEGVWKKGTLTMEAKEGESAEDLMNRTAHTVESWFFEKAKTNMAEYGTPLSSEVEVQKGRGDPIQGIIDDINSCKDIKVLETYKLLVRGNDKLQRVYDHQMAQLKQKKSGHKTELP